ncbi:hypothetical protein C2G38_2157441 [Gigaspora rosea]|uniref:RING-type domain-containing protein n=1 Tax=Gigaspora rosea TaxID=44941 RepID=A0A397W4Y1_9GLOM|nr:hypothetical protein C2G38_2157441 [Gigaspora rosea]
MGIEKKLQGPCIIKICKEKSSTWRTVTGLVLSQGTKNKTLPDYIKENDVICFTCYNAIVVNASSEFQKHDLDLHSYIEAEISNQPTFLSFSQAVELITNVLYEREHNSLPTIWNFEEFRILMESKDERIAPFFDELLLSANLGTKNKNTMDKVSKQLLFLCYFICGIRNKFVNNAKRDLGMFLDFAGTPDSTIDTLAALGITITSRSIAYHKDAISKNHSETVESNLATSTNNVLILNIDDYHSIHSKRMPNSTTTSTAEHLATILLNPIKNRPPIPRQDIHNPVLVDASLIKTEIDNHFMSAYSLSHNRRWGFRFVTDEKKLEELTVHSYDVRLKEKRSTRSIKDAILVDLVKTSLHSIENYIKAINVAISTPMINRHIKEGNVIPVIDDWPGQIFLRTAISRYLVHGSSSEITDKILSFLPMLGPLHKKKKLAKKPKPWRINLLLELLRSAWQEIAKMVEIKFGYECKDAEYITLKDLLDNTVPLVLDIYSLFFCSGDFNSYIESCFRVWVLFFRFHRRNYTKAPLMFLSNVFYWNSKNHSILETISSELPKFSDTPVKIFHSLLHHNTEKFLTSEQIVREARQINYLRFNDDGFKENFVHSSSWAVYPYSSRNIETLTQKTACFLLDCFSDIYIRINCRKTAFVILPQVAKKRPSKKSKKEESANADNSIPIPAMKMEEAWLCHLPLGYSSSYKPRLSGCDFSNCAITNEISEETGRVLPCGHAYHDICFRRNKSKCLHCLDYIKSGVDMHVQSLLGSLSQLNLGNVVESDDTTPEDNDDDTKESADSISAPWNDTIWRFLLL